MPSTICDLLAADARTVLVWQNAQLTKTRSNSEVPALWKHRSRECPSAFRRQRMFSEDQAGTPLVAFPSKAPGARSPPLRGLGL